MTARVALERVPGVDSADVSYEEGRAVVRFDPNVTSPDEFIAELERMTGFGAVVRTAELQDVQGRTADEPDAGMQERGGDATDRSDGM